MWDYGPAGILFFIRVILNGALGEEIHRGSRTRMQTACCLSGRRRLGWRLCIGFTLVVGLVLGHVMWL